ncbi:site-specific DNA-methyltransferase [Hydrogenobacter hydrogenophilus]|uniref:site-specific DNA-methyltransferase (adenine-specific) n=1 Tax=Hydrogenobacter hydrogenophilus TaxID=35835 RepID=A0A285NZJ0_9AQUI|nr:site-specific DNA-methyltransferase [Hydrogenobacter hydrogenophilus]SNZ14353.1 adenine-specific DNA-methyltransferase [Hydrogenobacter hydrogenophilus]
MKEKFLEKLKEIFQFESSDLDFGIYRIFNYKRKRIEDFIEKELPNKIESAFEKHKKGISENINQEFERIKQKVLETLGEPAFTPTGDLNEKYKDAPIFKEYQEIKERKEQAEKIDEIKNLVYNDLYTFFSRFYEDGDFVPQYRYSIKGHRYAIPYNGEEVKLYWANADQYYIKTGILFRDYTFNTSNFKVIFRLEQAEEDELSTNKQKEKQKRFTLSKVELNDEKELVIYFKYKTLSEDEIKELENKINNKDNNNAEEGQKNSMKQEKINEVIFEKIKNWLLKNKQLELYKQLIEEKRNEKPLLFYHINRYTAKNTRDYFIHKDLKRFLSEQLDYFIKAEVLNYETLSQEKYIDKHITRAKTVKEIGETIINFLSHIEDFQKKLWEKKKFVLNTEYVITLDRIKDWTDEEFYKEVVKKVLENKEQLKEWEELGFGKIENEKDLEGKKLPIDTKYFDEGFKFKLLEKISEKKDLEDVLDGLLIKSENWQALNTILNKYKEKVQTIYIDPPFNKEQDADYLYNVKYKDSTWITMLENRIRLGRELLNERGSMFVRCDYNGNMYVRLLMNEIFGEENFRNEIVVSRTKKIFIGVQGYNVANDSLFFYTKSNNFTFNPIYKTREGKQKWLNMHSPGERNPPERIILGRLFYPPKGRHWTFVQERIYELEKQGRIRINEDIEYIDIFGNKVKGMPQYLTAEEELLDSNWTDISGYSQTQGFPTENSEILLKRVIESTSNEGDLVLDFFLGSGTTTATAHKLKRKWIGIEVGEHFYTVVLPRMKKVLAYDKSGISKEKDVKEKYNEKTAGGFFKYITLEQYEDALDNIELKENEKMKELFKNEYLIKYFLDIETRESPYLLNIEHLKNPFAYKLKINDGAQAKEVIVDIPETFNYLLGIKVKKVKLRENKNGGKYLFILGEKEGKDIAIVWREYSEDWKEEDFKEDKEYIKQELKDWKPSVVYISGKSILTPDFGDFQADIMYIEPEFKRLMGI